MKRITVPLAESDRNSRTYGIVLMSEQEFDFTGPNIHNRSHGHVLQVWDNTARPAQDGSGQMVDPFGKKTSERYSYSWSPQATVIALHPDPNRPRRATTPLRLGDVVVLTVHDYVIGEFQCRAKPLHNPHLVPVDTSSSASVQHYIDTGDYLSPGEEV